MAYRSLNHIALRVAPLRGAEEFYCHLFGMRVAFREAETADGWRTLPPGATWDDAEAAGVALDLSMLARDGLKLALVAARVEVRGAGRLDHVCFEADAEDLDGLRSRVRTLDLVIAVDRPGTLTFDDPFGVRWEVRRESVLRSTGESTGRWLRVGREEPRREDGR